MIPLVAKRNEIHKPSDSKNTSFLLLRLLLLQKHFSFCAISQTVTLVSFTSSHPGARQMPSENTELLMMPYGLLMSCHYTPSHTAPTYTPFSPNRSCPDYSSMHIIYLAFFSSFNALLIAAAYSGALCLCWEVMCSSGGTEASTAFCSWNNRQSFPCGHTNTRTANSTIGVAPSD